MLLDLTGIEPIPPDYWSNAPPAEHPRPARTMFSDLGNSLIPILSWPEIYSFVIH